MVGSSSGVPELAVVKVGICFCNAAFLPLRPVVLDLLSHFAISYPRLFRLQHLGTLGC